MLHSSRLHLQGTFAPSRDFRRHPDLFSLPIPIFDKADVVVEGNYYVGRQPHMPIEPDVGYVYHDDNGKLVIHSKSIGIHLHLYMIAPGLGVEPENLVLIQNNAGGTFGCKFSPTMEALWCIAGRFGSCANPLPKESPKSSIRFLQVAAATRRFWQQI